VLDVRERVEDACPSLGQYHDRRVPVRGSNPSAVVGRSLAPFPRQDDATDVVAFLERRHCPVDRRSMDDCRGCSPRQRRLFPGAGAAADHHDGGRRFEQVTHLVSLHDTRTA